MLYRYPDHSPAPRRHSLSLEGFAAEDLAAKNAAREAALAAREAEAERLAAAEKAEAEAKAEAERLAAERIDTCF